MNDQKEFQFSLRYYFVLLFFMILVVTSIAGLFVIVSLRQFFLIQLDLTVWLAIYSLMIILLGGSIMWFGSVHLTNPISSLNDSVKSISQGNYDHKIFRKVYQKDTAKYHNEIDQLAQNINQMSDDLKKTAQHRADFIANFSHELKTPIASLVGLSDILADKQLDASTREELTTILQSESLRLSRLCDDIVTLTQMEQHLDPKQQSVNIEEQIRHAIIMISEKWKDKKLSLTFDTIPVTCMTDSDLTMQVWTNIIDNAFKYSDNPVRLRITIKNQKEVVNIYITDHGMGIDVKEQAHIFEQFYQVERSHTQEGNGLGFAIVTSILESLGGSIFLESQLGKGSTFKITLPLK